MSETAMEGRGMTMQEILRALEGFDEVELQDVTIHVDKLVLRRAKGGGPVIEVMPR
jgi:hypothetical protein